MPDGKQWTTENLNVDIRSSYCRLEAHGFYWTATETDPNSAWFYNFGKGGALRRGLHQIVRTETARVRCLAGE
jgi:hypothetical protein